MRLCPLVEHEAKSGEGALAWRVAGSPGVWARAGMTGALAGLNWPAALAFADALEAGADREALGEYLSAVEAGALEGEAQRAARDAPEQS